MRNLTSSDFGIPLVVIQLGVTGLKKTKVVYLLELSEGSEEKEQCNLVSLERLWVIGLMVVMLISIHVWCVWF